MDPHMYNDDFAQASEYLRLALNLLSKHGIPPSPFNFRMGYDSVSGSNDKLQPALEQIAGQSGGSSADDLGKLYNRTYLDDHQALESVRQGLRTIVAGMQGQLEHSGKGLAGYAETLTHFSALLGNAPDPKTISTEVDKVIANTRTTELSQQQLGAQLYSVADEVSALRNELELIRQESLTDALTGVANRKAFDSALETRLLDAREQNQPFCVLLADIDHFKSFNDSHGHLIGDKVLRFVASTIKRCVKGRDLVARFGGEEFAVILPQTDLTGANAVAEEIRKTVSAGQLKDKKKGDSYGRVTISIGMACFVTSDLPHELVQRADKALYLAKERGRNRVEKAA